MKNKMKRMYNKVYFQNSFRLQCLDVDPLTMIQFDRAIENAKSVAEKINVDKLKILIGTGCGDSNLVSPVVKQAFSYYLPDVIFRWKPAIELSRYHDYMEKGESVAIVAISQSGSVVRTNETLYRGNKHGYTTIGMSRTVGSECSKAGKYFYNVNTPDGDNNAGLRTYFANVLALIILAAAISEKKYGINNLNKLREEVSKYHDDFYLNIEQIDDLMFEYAIKYKDNINVFEICADGPLYWIGKFIEAKLAEVSGDVCTVTDSENYFHLNKFMYPNDKILEIIIFNSNDDNEDKIINVINDAYLLGRRILLFSDKNPKELKIKFDIDYCHLTIPNKEYNFLISLYSYIPASIFTGYRSTVLGEPFFRGGFNPVVMQNAYLSDKEVLD